MADWTAELPGTAVEGNSGHPEDHNKIVAAITEVRTNVDKVESAGLKIGTTATTALAGNTAIPSIPAALSAADAQAGTATAQRTITAKVLADEVDRRVASALAPLEARVAALETPAG